MSWMAACWNEFDWHAPALSAGVEGYLIIWEEEELTTYPLDIYAAILYADRKGYLFTWEEREL